MAVNRYGGIIWTYHALDRLNERGFSQEMARLTFSMPDKSFAGKEEGTTEYQKKFGSSRVTVVAKPNDKKEWVVLSCWIDPPLPGTKDAIRKEKYLEYKNATGLKKWWLILVRQLGF